MVRPGRRVGYQEVLQRFFSALGSQNPDCPLDKPPEAAAFCRARQKIPLEVFQQLFDRAVEQVLQSDGGAAGPGRWRGLRVHAIDGTKVTLPSSKELADFFGVPVGAHFPQALVCTLYDVLTRCPVDLVWGPYQTSERDLARHLYAALGVEDLVLFDRGFPSFALFADLVAQGVHFLCRLPKSGPFGEVATLIAKGRRDCIVTIGAPDEFARECEATGLPVPAPLVLRFVRCRHRKAKEPSYFLTTLTDHDLYSRGALCDLYHLRWEEEEFFKLAKESLELESMRGTKPLLVHQEIMAIHLYCILTRLLTIEAARRQGVAPSEIAQTHALHAVSRYLDHLLTARTLDDCQRLLDRCITEIGWRRYRTRPDRTYPRRSKSSYGKWGRKGAGPAKP